MLSVILLEDMEDVSVWLFNIKPENWQGCVGGPPDINIHGNHVGNPWHGLSKATAYAAAEMKSGETAIIRKSGHGIVGIWTIRDTAVVGSQEHHRWPDDYAYFVYCEPLVRAYDTPVNDSDFIDGEEFVYFNRAANRLSPEYADRFLSNILERATLTDEVRAHLIADLMATRNQRKRDEAEHTGNDFGVVTGVPILSDTAGTTRELTSERVVVREAFRNRILRLYNEECLLTDLVGSPFVTLSHILSRSAYPEYAEHPQNVMILNWLHHQAFDAELFTLDPEYRLHVHPEFSIENSFLQETLIRCDGEQTELPEGASLSTEFLEIRNESLEWYETT